MSQRPILTTDSNNKTVRNIPAGRQWELLVSSDPTDVCRGTGISYNNAGYYNVNFMNRKVTVFPSVKSMEIDGEPASNFEFVLTILSYLLIKRNIILSGKWVSERDLKSGSTFFRGPHVLPVATLLQRFGRDAQGFIKAGIALGGTVLREYGDAAIQIAVLPGMPVQCVLWCEDDEFPTRFSYLFDSAIDRYIALDVLLAMCHSMINCFVSNA